MPEISMSDLRELLCPQARQTNAAPGTFWTPGRSYFIRTVTHHHVGRLVRVEHTGYSALAILTECSWIADDGKFSDSMANGTFNEIEPFPPTKEVAVNLGSMIDAVEWTHKLPIGVK